MTNDEVMRKALEALEYMHSEKCDYMIRNKLGDPSRETATKLAVAAIAGLRNALSARPEPQAAVSEEAILPLPTPWDYCYEWTGPYGKRKFSAAHHNGRACDNQVPVYTGEQMREFARAVLAASRQVPVGDDAKDAARYRWMRCVFGTTDDDTRDAALDALGAACANPPTPEEFDAAIDAGMRAVTSPLPVGEPRQEEGERSGPSGVERMEQALRDQEAHFEKVYADGVTPCHHVDTRTTHTGDGKPCPNDHDPDCRWPECNCRTTGVPACEPGYRLLTAEDRITLGDEYLSDAGVWTPVHGISIGMLYGSASFRPCRRRTDGVDLGDEKTK